MNRSRRKFLALLAATFASAPFHLTRAATPGMSADTGDSNFRYIYGNDLYKAEFFDFLTNVFHLFPETSMHELIDAASQEFVTDQAIYSSLQSNIADIKPFLGDLTYAIPALIKQKRVMAEQTSSLLDTDRRYEGYIEFGSTGRYLDALEERLDIDGDIHFVSDRPATYSIPDMIDRGQIFKAGKFTHLANYQTDFENNIPLQSIDLVTVYIGFHHCPIPLREEFIGAIRDRMTDNARLILRDHDVVDNKMQKLVSLAHDVFNMGTDETWSYNANELRQFYSLAELDALLVKTGFKSDGRTLFQQGDPTKNALMVYRKS